MITIYTKDNCPKCVAEKSKLVAQNKQFDEIYIYYGGEKDPNITYIDREEFMKLFPTIRSLPHIVIS